MSFDFDATVVGAGADGGVLVYVGSESRLVDSARPGEFEGCICSFWQGPTGSLAIGEAVSEMLAHD